MDALISIETRQYPRVIAAILEAYGEAVVVPIDGEEFVGSEVTELALDGCTMENIEVWRNFEVLRDGRALWGFHDHPRELWALPSEMPLVEKLHREGLASFSVCPRGPKDPLIRCNADSHYRRL